MTPKEYNLLKTMCDTQNYTCADCICRYRGICFKQYLSPGVKDFPIRKYKELTKLEKLYVDEKSFPMVIQFVRK